MNVFEVIEKRRSIRSYKPDPVPDAVLTRLLNAARAAPSGCARWGWKLIVVRDQETKSKIANACKCRFPGSESRLHQGNPLVKKAPVVIVACSLVRVANMRYFGLEGEDPIIFSNLGRNPGLPKYWQEYVEHSKHHKGEYESMGIWDLAAALDHLSLAAVEEGLGTCLVGMADEREFRKILSIPDEVQARMLMTLGYPADSSEKRSRKPREELICYDKYS